MIAAQVTNLVTSNTNNNQKHKLMIKLISANDKINYQCCGSSSMTLSTDLAFFDLDIC